MQKTFGKTHGVIRRKLIENVMKRREAMVCPKCHSSNVNVQAVSEVKKRGCFGTALWLLLAVCTCGLILLIPLLRGKKTETKQYAVCQNCGNRWYLSGNGTGDYVLICNTCGMDYVSSSKSKQKCKLCNGRIVYSGMTRSDWVALDKVMRDKIRSNLRQIGN